MYSSIFIALIFVFILSMVGTLILNIIFRFLGERGYLGNLFPNVRGGIPDGSVVKNLPEMQETQKT